MRARAEKSPAVRFFTIHSFDDQPDIRAATMRTLLDHLAAGRIRPYRAYISYSINILIVIKFLEFNGFGSETVSHAKPITSNKVTGAGRRRDMGYAYVPDRSTSMGERSFSDDNTRYH
jgi:hypothetical protein